MPVTIDNQTALFALLVLILFAGTGMLLRRPSMKQSKQRQQVEWAQNGAPEHALVDDHASIGANVACFLFCAIGTYLACSILFGNILWVTLLLGGK